LLKKKKSIFISYVRFFSSEQIIIEELRRSINASTIDNKPEESTTRIQILKRNKSRTLEI